MAGGVAGEAAGEAARDVANAAKKHAALVVEHVEKRFGGLRAVSDVSFVVPKGAIFGLIGPNGAGKTTVFNLITGVYRVDAGSISLDGEGPRDDAGKFLRQDITHLSPSRVAYCGVARTFQNIRLFASMSAIENVLVAGELDRKAGLGGEVIGSRTSRDDERRMEDRACELLDALGLLDVADAPATSLPYGSQRRLEIARALMTKPKLLLLDEPAAGLNYGEAEKLKDEIRALRDTYALTVVLVEHNMQVVMGVCDRIHVLDHGVTIAEGSPDEVRKDPKVIAAYLGEPREEGEGGERGSAVGESNAPVEAKGKA